MPWWNEITSREACCEMQLLCCPSQNVLQSPQIYLCGDDLSSASSNSMPIIALLSGHEGSPDRNLLTCHSLSICRTVKGQETGTEWDHYLSMLMAYTWLQQSLKNIFESGLVRGCVNHICIRCSISDNLNVLTQSNPYL